METSLPIGQFVKKALTDIKAGMTGDFILGNVTFDVSVVLTEKASGGIDLTVIGGELGKTSQTTQRMNFTAISKEASTHESKKLKVFFDGFVNLDEKGKKRK